MRCPKCFNQVDPDAGEHACPTLGGGFKKPKPEKKKAPKKEPEKKVEKKEAAEPKTEAKEEADK